MLTHARLARTRRRIVTLPVTMIERAIHATSARQRLRAFMTDSDGNHALLGNVTPIAYSYA
jgi:hypothetical protein